MDDLVRMLPLVVAVGALIYLVVRNLGRVWLDHRVKLALLEKLEQKPELLNSFQELQTLLDGSSSDPEVEQRQDLTLTGVMLAVLGAACVVLYASVGRGVWAVGAYWGGVICVVLGFILALIGLLIRFLTRSPFREEED